MTQQKPIHSIYPGIILVILPNSTNISI